MKYIVKENDTLEFILNKLSTLSNKTVFVINKKSIIVGSVSDGDIRRGLLKNLSKQKYFLEFMNRKFSYLQEGDVLYKSSKKIIEKGIMLIPYVTREKKIIDFFNFNNLNCLLPIHAVIMAGGKGSRLKPLTDKIPKPLLKVGNLPIIEHNLKRLISYGIKNFDISINYLGDQIKNYLQKGSKHNIKINYVNEDRPMGTIGSVSIIENFFYDCIIISNSDILTNLNYESFYLDFIKNKADMSILSIPYKVQVPYAVLESSNGVISNLKEKPTYTYFSNGGIYLLKKSVLNYIPKDKFFNATDLIEKLINENKKVITYEFSGYWLDIGRHDDFQKAQKDLKNISF